MLNQGTKVFQSGKSFEGRGSDRPSGISDSDVEKKVGEQHGEKVEEEKVVAIRTRIDKNTRKLWRHATVRNLPSIPSYR